MRMLTQFDRTLRNTPWPDPWTSLCPLTGISSYCLAVRVEKVDHPLVISQDCLLPLIIYCLLLNSIAFLSLSHLELRMCFASALRCTASSIVTSLLDSWRLRYFTFGGGVSGCSSWCLILTCCGDSFLILFIIIGLIAAFLPGMWGISFDSNKGRTDHSIFQFTPCLREWT